MKAKVKELISLELEDNLEEYCPNDFNNFGTWVRMMIGPDNSTGAESFDILICTPTWLNKEYSERKIFWGKNMLIVFEYDLNDIKSYISKYIDSFQAEDWHSLALMLSRVGAWEFENYQKIEGHHTLML